MAKTMATGKWVSDGQMEFGSEFGILKSVLVLCAESFEEFEGKKSDVAVAMLALDSFMQFLRRLEFWMP
jgi:hypothetical protein